MSHQNETKAINQTLHSFASALNSADTASLASLFTEESEFMPDGYATIEYPGLLNKRGKKYLVTTAFQIQFTVLDIEVNGAFAFLTAKAETLQNDKDKDTRLSKTSRDFFVFKKNAASWKIHRYIFNNIKIR
jgi:ketosteroid isomerase-like protein